MKDKEWVEKLKVMEKWKEYMGEGLEEKKYKERKKILKIGREDIYKEGQWEIGMLNKKEKLKMGELKKKVKNDGDK